MRRPGPFAAHPVSFDAAQARGCYRAVCEGVVDGDTFYALVDLGFYCYTYHSIRIQGIDAPELFSGTPESRQLGLASRDQLRLNIEGMPLLLDTDRDRTTFGRFVATAFGYKHDGVKWVEYNVGDLQVAAGHATISGG